MCFSMESESMSLKAKRSKYTEVLITISLAAILIVVAIPAVGNFRDNRNAQQIVDLAEKLSAACVAFHKDVGRPAVEFTASKDGVSYVHPRFHELSMPQSIRGWQGPYIEEPLSREMNPFGQSIYLQSKLSAYPAHGFVLHGITQKKSEGPGQFVVFHGVPSRVGEQIDAILDEKVGGRQTWKSRGRVEWAPGGGGSLSICLTDSKSE